MRCRFSVVRLLGDKSSGDPFMLAGRRRLTFGLLLGLAVATTLLPMARSHDIPNQRLDRSIQVTVRPGRLEIAHEVSLSELTLTQDLRAAGR